MSDTLELQTFGDVDLYVQDELFSDLLLAKIEAAMLEGHNPVSAAKMLGIPRTKFRKWLENPSFQLWVSEVQHQYFGQCLKKINEWIDGVAENDKRAASELLIKHLAHLDKEYGAKHSNIDARIGPTENIESADNSAIRQIVEETRTNEPSQAELPGTDS